MSERTFDLRILGSAGAYTVQAESETQGQAEASFQRPDSLTPLADLRDRRTSPGDLEALGADLHRGLFTGAVASLYSSALGEILQDDRAVLRLRLRIDPPELAALPWELLFDPDRGRFLAGWSRTWLSRHFPLLEPVRRLELPARIRILAVFPLKSGLETESERQALRDFEAGMAGRVVVRWLEGAVTDRAIRDALRSEEIHILHYGGHAGFQKGEGHLLLDGTGPGQGPLAAPAFARLLEDHTSLRLVLLNACEGARLSPHLALAGLAPRLLRHGIPAVVAMQTLIADSRALRFAAELYGELVVEGWAGQVERAVTRARSVLLQERPERPDFATPVLYLRSAAGWLWQPRSPSGEATPGPPVAAGGGAGPALHVPSPPWSFLGRSADLHRLTDLLAHKAGSSPRVVVKGWPGVGKTTMTSALANDTAIRGSFPDGVLWTALDQEPDLLRMLRSWCIALGSPGFPLTATVDEASRQLEALLARRRVLLLIDDTWDAVHALPFLVGGPGCAALVTTRLDVVAGQLARTPGEAYRLLPLDVEAGLELLASRAPEVVAAHPEECRQLVVELEGLPLALHVAGRMLQEDNRLWEVGELLGTLRSGEPLLQEPAPDDRVDLRTQTLPTVAVLLAKSTERLRPELLERFALLGVFAPKPATMDLAALRAVWQVDDPRPTVRELVRLGLLEEAGRGWVRMHALLVAHAKSLFED